MGLARRVGKVRMVQAPDARVVAVGDGVERDAVVHVITLASQTAAVKYSLAICDLPVDAYDNAHGRSLVSFSVDVSPRLTLD